MNIVLVNLQQLMIICTKLSSKLKFQHSRGNNSCVSTPYWIAVYSCWGKNSYVAPDKLPIDGTFAISLSALNGLNGLCLKDFRNFLLHDEYVCVWGQVKKCVINIKIFHLMYVWNYQWLNLWEKNVLGPRS